MEASNDKWHVRMCLVTEQIRVLFLCRLIINANVIKTIASEYMPSLNKFAVTLPITFYETKYFLDSMIEEE